MARQTIRFLNGPQRVRTVTIAIALELDVDTGARIEGVGVGRQIIVEVEQLAGGMRARNAAGGAWLTVAGGVAGEDMPALPGGGEPPGGFPAYTISGSYVGQTTTEEIIELTYGDGATIARIYEREVVGATRTSTLTLGSTTVVSISETITTGTRGVILARCVAGARVYTLPFSPTYPLDVRRDALCTLTPALPFACVETVGETIISRDYTGRIDYPQGYLESAIEQRAGIPAAGVRVAASWRNVASSAFTTPTGTTGNYSQLAAADAITQADRACYLDVRLQSQDLAATETLRVSVPSPTVSQDVTGSATIPLRQRTRQRVVGLTVGDGPTSGNATRLERQPVSMSGATLPGVPEGFLAGLRCRGWDWHALTATYSGDLTMDDGSTLTPGTDWPGVWSGAGGGTATVSGGAILISGAAGKSLRRTITGRRWQRLWTRPILRVRLRASAAPHTITLEASDFAGDIYPWGGSPGGPKRWSLTTGAAATFTDIDIDLGAETNGLPYSHWQSRIAAPVPADPSRSGAHFGGLETGEIRFTGLGAGTYEIDSLSLIDGGDAPKIHAQAYGVGAGFSGSAADIRIAHAESRGLTCLEVPGSGNLRLLDVATRSEPAGAWATPGWLVTDAKPLSGALTFVGTGFDGFSVFQTDRVNLGCSAWPSILLAAGGLMFSGSWATKYGPNAIALSGGTFANLPAQWLIDTLEWEWPDALLSFPGGGSALGFGALLPRGGAWGRALTSARAPLSGSAELRTLTGTAAIFTDTIDAIGRYELPSFAAPAAGLGGRHRVVLAGASVGGAPDPSAEVALALGRVRLCLIADPGEAGGGSPVCDTSEAGLTAAVDVRNTNELWLGLSNDWETRSFRWRNTGLGGTQPCVRWLDRDAPGRLLILYRGTGGAVEMARADDALFPDLYSAAGVWSVATIAAAGGRPAMDVHPAGWLLVCWRTSGAAIEGAWVDRAGGVIRAAFTVVGSGVADDSIGVTFDPPAQRWYVLYRTTGGAIASLSSADGVTFA